MHYCIKNDGKKGSSKKITNVNTTSLGRVLCIKLDVFTYNSYGLK